MENVVQRLDIKELKLCQKKTKINESSRKHFSKNEETYNGTIRTRCCNVS